MDYGVSFKLGTPIYTTIKKASETNMISEQIAAIKQTQETYMSEQEKQVT